MARSSKIHPADIWDAQQIARSARFTVFRARGRGEHIREEHDTLTQARSSASGDPRALIYAITPEGSTVLVPASYAPPST